jgi:mannosyltransferase
VTPSAQLHPSAPVSGRRTSASGPERRSGWLCLWPGLLTLALCLYQAGRPQLWRDEFASASAASRSFGQLFGLLGKVDASTGCYYLLLHVWISVFGSSPASLRTPSAIAMAGAAVLITQIGARLYGRASGVAGGLVFALIPAVSRYGQEARAYAFALFAVALATLLLLRALDRPGRSRWVGYAASLVLVCAAHVIAVSCLLGHAVAVLLRWRRNRERGPLLGFAGAALLGLALAAPLMLLAHSQVNSQLSWLGPPDLADPLHMGLDLWTDLYASRIAALIVGALALAGVAVPLLRRSQREATVFLLAAGILPVIAIAVVSQFGTSYFLGRYLLFTDVAWAVLAGAGLVGAARLLAERVRLPQAGRRAPLAALAAVLAVALGLLAVWPNQQGVRAYGAHEWTHYPRGKNPGYYAYQGAADLLARQARPGDGVVYLGYQPIMLDLGVQYYLGHLGSRSSRTALDEVFVTRTAVQNDSYFPTFCPDPAACLAKAPDRIWVVELVPTSGEPRAERAQQKLLHAQYRTGSEHRLSQVDVALMVRRS